MSKLNVNDVIDRLPDRLRDDYKLNAKDFGGTTVQMDTAGGKMITNLRNMWEDVVNNGFECSKFGFSPKEWIDSYIDNKSKFYGILSEPSGPGTGGTIVGQIVAGYLMSDLQNLIEETVSALISEPDDTKKFDEWKKRWRDAQS